MNEPARYIMKTKPIILMAILLLKGPCYGQAPDAQAAFDREWEQSIRMAGLYYPDSAISESQL